jgi:uncharacterized membrane protein YbhN (UPF0104 family)
MFDYEMTTHLKKSVVWHGAKIVLAIILAGFVLSQTSIDILFALFQRTSIRWLLLGTCFYCAMTWMSARRYWILIDRRVPFFNFLNIFILQNAITNLFASSAGLASYVAILRGEHKIQVSRGVASLFLANLSDAIVICLAIGLSSIFVWSQTGAVHWLVIFMLMGVSGGVGLLLLAILFRQQFANIVVLVASNLRINRFVFFNRVLDVAHDLVGKKIGEIVGFFGIVLVRSLLVLMLTLMWAYCNMRAFQVPIDIWAIIFVVSLLQIMSVVPIQVFGGIGVYDVAIIYLYGLFGVSQVELATVAIGLRLIFYTLNLFLLLYLPLGTYISRVREHEHYLAP